jgi:hypothetical protein
LRAAVLSLYPLWARRLILLAVLVLCAGQASAHKVSDSYLTLTADDAREGRLTGRWDISVRDLDAALALDADRDGKLEWREIEGKTETINAYAFDRLELAAQGSQSRRCVLSVIGNGVDEHADGVYAVIDFSADCGPGIGTLSIDYRLLFDIDAEHRGLFKLAAPGGTTSAVFSADRRVQAFRMGAPGVAEQLAGFVVDGVKHIAIGFDHVLFLVALLLPAVLVREGRIWRPATAMPSALANVAGIVTAFTIAHSVTLSVAALGILTPPSRWVEALIAASVVLTAIDNLVPCLPRRRWLVAFAFGLLHGFGFAGVLTALNLPRADLVLSLVGFNVGVELGQLALVAVVVPAAYALRARPAYPRWGVAGSSLAIAFIAAGWLLERSLQIEFMPF